MKSFTELNDDELMSLMDKNNKVMDALSVLKDELKEVYACYDDFKVLGNGGKLSDVRDSIYENPEESTLLQIMNDCVNLDFEISNFYFSVKSYKKTGKYPYVHIVDNI